jgi:hypothetical protein
METLCAKEFAYLAWRVRISDCVSEWYGYV